MKIRWRGALGIVISAAMLVYVFRPIDWTDVVHHVRAANIWLLLLGGVLTTGMFPLRAIRWRVILDPVAPKLPLRRNSQSSVRVLRQKRFTATAYLDAEGWRWRSRHDSNMRPTV